jgi:UDP-GlcNAc:undecaprenyl-phosphate/decaprenyl-phosphate GlcNAc-1-phosphate transferase
LGLSVAILSISFMNVSSNSEKLNFLSPPIVVLGVILIPVTDTLRVMVIRILEGRSPFSPDRNHIHHQFLASGTTHKAASIALYFVNIALVLTVIIFNQTASAALGVLLLLVGSASTQILVFLRYKQRDKKVGNLSTQLEALEKENQFLK